MTLELLRFFALLAIFVFVVIIVQQAANATLTRQRNRNAVNKRLKLLASGMDREAVTNLLKVNHAGSFRRRGIVVRLRRMLARTGMSITPDRILAGMAIATAVAIILLSLLAFSLGTTITLGTVLLICVVGLGFGAGIPYVVLNRSAEKRRKRMEQQFAPAVDIFTRALRAGHPVASAISLLSTEMADPIGTEFGLVADEIAYGANLNDSLVALAERWELEDLHMFAVCLSVQSETGGNLAEILGNLASVIRDRASLYQKVRALSSEGRASAWMLSVLPALTMLVLFMINPSFYLEVSGDPLFATSFAGMIGLYLIGVLWLRSMVDLKV